jgi:hypothetical protein
MHETAIFARFFLQKSLQKNDFQSVFISFQPRFDMNRDRRFLRLAAVLSVLGHGLRLNLAQADPNAGKKKSDPVPPLSDGNCRLSECFLSD